MWLCHTLNLKGFKVDITSMVRPAGQIPGESGVHATGRAIDCIPVETKESGPVTTREMTELADIFCRLFPRDDGKTPLMWHQVAGGGGYHFHIQCQATSSYRDLAGSVPQDK